MDSVANPTQRLVGQPKSALDTPALVVDLDAMEANIARIVATCRAHGVAWRPHSKAHKTPEIAQMQILAGAMGVTCAKLGEAEVMAGAGIRDILIANQIVGHEKVTRLANLQRHADVMVAIDSRENAREISDAAVEKGVKVRVLVEVNVGLNRAGVEPGDAVVSMSDYAASLPGLRYSGVMGWE